MNQDMICLPQVGLFLAVQATVHRQMQDRIRLECESCGMSKYDFPIGFSLIIISIFVTNTYAA